MGQRSMFKVLLTGILCLSILVVPALAQDMRPPMEIRVGVYENAPKVFTAENGQVVGLFPDLLKYIAHQEGWTLKYVPGTWAECLGRLERGDLDVMVDVAFSEARAKRFEFSSETVLINWGMLYTRRGLRIDSVVDLQGKRVAVMQGSIHTDGTRGIKSLLRDFDIECALIEVTDYQGVFSLLDRAQADVGVVNRLFGTLHQKKYGVVPSPVVFNPRHLRFAFPKKGRFDRHVLERIDHHLAFLKDNFGSVYHRAISAYLSGLPNAWALVRPFGMEDRPIALTPKEREWLQKHPVVRIGVDAAYAPYSFVDENGQYQGAAMDFVALISNRLGITMEVVPGLSWPEIVEGSRKRELDVIVTAVKTREREKFLGFTQEYLPTPLVIMTRQEDDSIRGPWGLSGKKVALVKGYSSTQRVITEHPAVDPLLVKTSLEGLRAVSAGNAQAYVGVLGVSTHLAEDNGIVNLKVAASYDMVSNAQRFAVRKDWPELVSILDKVLDAISEDQKLSVLRKWAPITLELQKAADSRLSRAELEWLQRHKAMRLGVAPAWAPFEYFDESGKYSGVVSDFVRLLNERMNVSMQPIQGLTWAQMLHEAGAGKVDVISTIMKTFEHSEQILFTEPYLSLPLVVITREDYKFINGIGDLSGAKIAVARGYVTQQYLERDFPGHDLVLVDDLEEAVDAVSNGKADALLETIAVTKYAERQMGIKNLRVAATTPYRYELSFGVRKDWPDLVWILNKSLANITETEKALLYDKWVNPRIERHVDWLKVGMSASFILLIAAVIVGLVLHSNRRLSAEIAERKKAERALQSAHDELEQRVKERTAELAETNVSLRAEIAERIRMEEFWRRYDFMVNTSKDMSSLINTDYTYEAVNDSYCRNMNRDRQEITGHTVADIWGEKVFRKKIGHNLNKCFAGEEVNYQEWFDVPNLGTQCLNVTYYPYRNHENKITHAVVVSNNITDFKGVEGALRESEEKYRNLVERANDGIVIIHNGLIKYANPSAIHLSGETTEGMRGKPFADYIHPDKVDKLVKGYNLLMSGEDVKSIFETIFKAKDGSYVYAEVNASLITYEGVPADLVIIRDITERKQAEADLQRAHDELEIKVAERTAELAVAKERAEESDRLKSAFLAAMSHELRTPLNSIIGFTGIMLQGLVGTLNAEQTKQLGMVRDSAHHLLSLINDVLDISKIEAGQLEIASESFDMRSSIDKVVQSVTPLADKKGLLLVAEIAPEVGQINSDRRRVEQILINLVNNALKFTDTGEVRISAQVVGCRLPLAALKKDFNLKAPKCIEICVADSGIGIKPEDIEKLFAAFQQIETGLARRYEGTGLGLSICKKLVKMLGGDIRAESEGPEKGSTFTLILPLD